MLHLRELVLDLVVHPVSKVLAHRLVVGLFLPMLLNEGLKKVHCNVELHREITSCDRFQVPFHIVVFGDQFGVVDVDHHVDAANQHNSGNIEALKLPCLDLILINDASGLNEHLCTVSEAFPELSRACSRHVFAVEVVVPLIKGTLILADALYVHRCLDLVLGKELGAVDNLVLIATVRDKGIVRADGLILSRGVNDTNIEKPLACLGGESRCANGARAASKSQGHALDIWRHLATSDVGAA